MFCSPVKKRENTSTLNFTNSSKSFITKATNYIKDAIYYTAFRIVLKNSKAAKTAFVKLVGQTVQQEMKSVKHNLIPLSEKLSQQSINEFNWEKTLTNIELQLPVLSTAVYHSGNQIEETSTNCHLTSYVSLVGKADLLT